MKFFYCSVFMIWLYIQKAMYRPCDLDLWPMKVNIFLCIEYHPINILHKFQIDISSNSWEIKYQNIGRTHTQTDRHTHTHRDRQTDRVKTIPRNPLRGRGNDTIQIRSYLQNSKMSRLQNQNKIYTAHMS